MKTREFSASLDELHAILKWIRGEASQVAFSSFQLYQIELASEEAIVNIIRHSKINKDHRIEITINIVDNRLEIVIADQGTLFNPLVQYHQKLTIDEKKVGGVGLTFIRKCMDEVSYQRKGNRNILTLIKIVI